MQRTCATCRRPLPLREFDLGEGHRTRTCLDCAGKRESSEHRWASDARDDQISRLERQRRTLIASLVKIDAEIASLREDSRAPVVRDRDESSDVFAIPDDLGAGD